MFAVKGWSVPASALKTQTSATQGAAPAAAPATGAGAPAKAGHKRKRGNKDAKASDVNEKNLADLWETVIEKKSKPEAQKEAKVKHGDKRQKVAKEDSVKDISAIAPDDSKIESADNEADQADAKIPPKLSERGEKRKALKDKKREKKAKMPSNDAPEKSIAVNNTTTPAPVVAKPQPKLTPLQASMRQKLISARFRHLNQTLYTTPSAHSLELFSQNPEMFHEYHEGFRRQVEVWPENPIDTYIEQIRQRGKVKGPARGKAAAEESASSSQLLPLPRTEGTCYIADLGCGDAMLTQTLEKEKKKLKVQVFSYDLQNPSPLVTKADIANLPLEDNSVDVAIFCLALMGTNWVDFIEEAFRILRWKGELWVAEIKSRFGRVAGKNKRVEHSVGNRKKPDKKTLKKMEEDADDADLLVEVDGHDDNTGETDVSAFVEVLRKRGFVLQSETAVDLRNKMFVKMTFVKGSTPIKGKCVPVPKGMEKTGQATWKPKSKAKFLEEEDAPVSSEASVLKPCVYKLR
jgi:ribosomal RNA-processing protein 8